MWWGWIVGGCAVGWVLFVAVFHPFRRGAHAASRALPVTRVDLPAVGSMSLADEQAYLTAPLPELVHAGDVLPWWGDRPLNETEAAAVNRQPGLYGIIPAVTVPLGPYGGQLGPRAQLVWDRWDTRCRERWGFSCVS